jgi:hypothetical protein
LIDPVSGDLTAWALLPFQSQAEMVAAMRNPEYRNPSNGAYREAVAKKLTVSPEGSTGFTAKIYDTEQRQETATGNEQPQESADEIKEAEEQLASIWGSMAVAPSKLAR